MSVAFTREDSAVTAQEVTLPERPISPHPNLVTNSGLEALQRAVVAAEAAFEAAREIANADARRNVSEGAVRDLSYFRERLRSAELRPDPDQTSTVAFGSRVTIEREDGRRQIFRIVGEDEAEPKNGSISYISPMARGLTGKRVGDVVTVAGHEVEIVEIG